MSETKATPNPWVRWTRYDQHVKIVAYSPEYNGEDGVAEIARCYEDPAIPGASIPNAERICLCCNTHDELVAALEVCAGTLRAIRMTYGFGSSRAQSVKDQESLETEIDKAWEPAKAVLAKARGEK